MAADHLKLKDCGHPYSLVSDHPLRVFQITDQNDIVLSPPAALTSAKDCRQSASVALL